MNKFWQFIVNIRDFGHHWSLKQNEGNSEYKHKVIIFISGYYATGLFIFCQALSYFFGIGDQQLPVGESDPWWVHMLAGAIVFILPIFLIGHLLLKKVEHIPISSKYNSRQYRKYMWIYWGNFLFSWFLAAFVGMLLIGYLRGREIHLFNQVFNEGGHNRTFQEDFGR